MASSTTTANRTTRRRRATAALLAGAVLTIAAAGCGSDDDTGDDETSETTAGDGTDPLADVQTFRVPSANHVTGRVDYPQTPPVGGDHNQVWLNCGAYDVPVPSEMAVHAMEHGAVWITYQPDLPEAEVETLDEKADQTYVVVSPWDGDDLPSPVVASAWGVQLQLDSADDPGLDAFLDAYREADSAPEPGAPCTGGAGDPISG